MRLFSSEQRAASAYVASLSYVLAQLPLSRSLRERMDRTPPTACACSLQDARVMEAAVVRGKRRHEKT